MVSYNIQNNKKIYGLHATTIISLAQLLGTSLWFSANSAAIDLMHQWQITVADIGWITNAVQAGFIIGTFVFAYTGIADHFKASHIFVCSALLGAFFNFCFAWFAHGLMDALIYRFLVGLCLAGIYPIGMKLIVLWAPHQAGQALAKLVAMLTLGTALPYFINSFPTHFAWQIVMICSSSLALIAALLIYQLGDPTASSKPQNIVSSGSTFQVFKIRKFRAAAIGYFGHMWELYAFWTIIPLFIAKSDIPEILGYNNISLLTFFVMACGAIGCLVGGYLSKHVGNRYVAIGSLSISGLSCLVFALGWRFLPAWFLLVLFSIWGASVIADSPQFSALSTQSCPSEKVGAALAIQNSIGFTLTIISIALTTYAFEIIGLDSAWILLIGPILGIAGFYYSANKGVLHV